MALPATACSTHDGTFTADLHSRCDPSVRARSADYKFSEHELSLAITLVDAVGIDTPVITDDTAPVVQEFVNSKASGEVFDAG